MKLKELKIDEEMPKDFWNYKVNQDNIKMFMVGFNSDVDINSIFDKVNNIV